MKRAFALLLALTLSLCCAALAEEGGFSAFAGTYYFSSGVGAWGTELVLNADGSFQGEFHDWDASGEMDGVESRNGVYYYCEFVGRLAPLQQLSDYEYSTAVQSLSLLSGDKGTWYFDDDDLMWINWDPYGLSDGAQLRFYVTGTPTALLPQGFLDWCIALRYGDYDQTRLPFPGFYNLTDDTGFEWSGEIVPEPTAAPDFGFTFLTPEATLPQLTARPAGGIVYPINGVVVNCKQSVTLRSAPSTKASALDQVPLGAVVTLFSNIAYPDDGHYFVDAAYNGQRGYIRIDYLDAILPDDLAGQTDHLRGAAGTVRAANPGNELILRAGPGTAYDNLGLLFGGEVLAYRGEAVLDGSGVCWYRCSHYGEDCWISARYTLLTLNDGRLYSGARGIY